MKRKVTLGVLASGRGTNLQAIIDAIERGSLNATVAIVISDRKEAEALHRAARHAIPFLFLDPQDFPDRRSYDGAIVQVLERHEVQLVILAGYMKILTPVLIGRFRHRIMNIHPSLLPAFPGLHSQQQAIEYGVKIAGCTVHFVEEEVDRGPVIIQAAVPVLEGDTPEGLAARILTQEHIIYPLAIQLYAEGRLSVVGRAVRISGTTTETFSPLVSPSLEKDEKGAYNKETDERTQK